MALIDDEGRRVKPAAPSPGRAKLERESAEPPRERRSSTPRAVQRPSGFTQLQQWTVEPPLQRVSSTPRAMTPVTGPQATLIPGQGLRLTSADAAPVPASERISSTPRAAGPVAPTPVMNASGYGMVTPTVPAEALPSPHPGATDFDRTKAAGQSDPNIAPQVPTQRTDYEIQFLQSLGWTLPDDSPLLAAPQTPTEMFSKDSSTDLASYTYQVDKAERDRITSKYRNVEGFIPPTNPAGVQYPDETPFEADVTTAELSWDAYNSLSDAARNAVDLNGLLVAARDQDLSREYKLEGDELNEYNRRTESIFGKPDTSTKIAPNVVRLLTSVNWSAVGQDLDEYLSLERAFTVDELKNLDTTNPEFAKLEIKEAPRAQTSGSGYGVGGGTNTASVNNFSQVRSEENMAAADAALALAAGKRFDEIMANPELNLWDLPSSVNYAMSGGLAKPSGARVPFGYGTQMDRATEQDRAKEAFYQSAYNYLVDAGNTDLQPLWNEMTAMGFNDADTNEFWRFVDDRTRKEQRWGQTGSPYGEAGRNYRSVDEVRKLVGLEG